jgi:hypothetical protein
VEAELDLGDHSKRIMVERDLCGWLNFRNKFCVFVPTHFDLLIILARVCLA